MILEMISSKEACKQNIPKNNQERGLRETILEIQWRNHSRRKISLFFAGLRNPIEDSRRSLGPQFKWTNGVRIYFTIYNGEIY